MLPPFTRLGSFLALFFEAHTPPLLHPSLLTKRGGIRKNKHTVSTHMTTSDASSRPQDHVFQLKDGRTMGYSIYGPSNPKHRVLYCHGYPSCRKEWHVFDTIIDGTSSNERLLNELSIQVILPDRPGYGLSSFNPNCLLIVDWVEDVKELMFDHLNILEKEESSDKTIFVLGGSGGAPYAMAVARELGTQYIHRLVLVCGMGPSEAPGMKDGMSWILPCLPRFIRRLLLHFVVWNGRRATSSDMAKQSAQPMSKWDQEYLLDPAAQPQRAEAMHQMFLGAFAQGIDGADLECERYKKCDWGFEIDDINVDTHIWHGKDDLNVHSSVAEWLGDRILTCRQDNVHIFDNEGHMTILTNHAKEIWSSMVAD